MRIDEELRRDVATAVRAIEQGSAAEVVVTIVPRSSGHWEVSLWAALAAAFLVQAGAALLAPDTRAPHLALDSALLALAAAWLVRRVPALERRLLPARVAAHRVELGAESAFCRQGIFRTRGHTGVLVYLSVLERRAVLLPDDALVQALPPDALAALRDQADRLFAGGAPRQALLALLDQLRRLAARHLPAGPADANELPDEPVTG